MQPARLEMKLLRVEKLTFLIERCDPPTGDPRFPQALREQEHLRYDERPLLDLDAEDLHTAHESADVAGPREARVVDRLGTNVGEHEIQDCSADRLPDLAPLAVPVEKVSTASISSRAVSVPAPSLIGGALSDTSIRARRKAASALKRAPVLKEIYALQTFAEVRQLRPRVGADVHVQRHTLGAQKGLIVERFAPRAADVNASVDAARDEHPLGYRAGGEFCVRRSLSAKARPRCDRSPWRAKPSRESAYTSCSARFRSYGFARSTLQRAGRQSVPAQAPGRSAR